MIIAFSVALKRDNLHLTPASDRQVASKADYCATTRDSMMYLEFHRVSLSLSKRFAGKLSFLHCSR